MPSQTLLPPLPPFDPNSNPTSLSTRWHKWVQPFQNFLVTMNIKDQHRKRAMLLHYAGEAVFNIFETLSSPGDANTGYFALKRHADIDTFKFRQTRQDHTETLDQYATRLRQLAVHCDFSDPSREMKIQIIQGCCSTHLRRKALRDPTMTLDDLLAHGRTFEAADRQAVVMEQGHPPKKTQPDSVCAVAPTNIKQHSSQVVSPDVSRPGGRHVHCQLPAHVTTVVVRGRIQTNVWTSGSR